MHFHIKEHNSNRKRLIFLFKSLWDQIRPCHKIGQGHCRVIIYINFIELSPLMLHTKFQGNWPNGYGAEHFFKVFTIYRHGVHLGHVTWTKYINFLSSPLSRDCI